MRYGVVSALARTESPGFIRAFASSLARLDAQPQSVTRHTIVVHLRLGIAPPRVIALLGLGLSIPAILQPRASLIVLSTRRQAAAELEMPLVQNPNPLSRMAVAGTGVKGEHHVHHDRRRLPLARRDTGIEMGRSRFKERLPHIGSDAASPLHSDSILFAHQCYPFFLADSCSEVGRAAPA